MSWTSQGLELLAWIFLFLAVESQQGLVSPPHNVSLLWVSGFQPQVSWAPPPHAGADCTYDIIWETRSDRNKRSNAAVKTQFYIVMDGGFLNVTVRTVCGGDSSKPAWLSVDHPELVRNLQCYIHAATQTHCSWQAASPAQDLRFFYWLLNNDGSQSIYETFALQECSAYSGGGSGCDLQADVHQTVHILFNATVNGTPATNTFKRDTADDVRPPPLHWTVTKIREKFHISWTPPEIKRPWKYTINYTECGEPKIITIDRETSTELNVIPRCAYRIAIKASSYKGETPYGDAKHFDADTDPNAWLYAAAIVPVMLAGLAALVLVCWRKNKEYIFPKVPEPRDFLSDISNNNNKDRDHSLYVPAEEGDNCKITLVEDPLINKLDM
ncbi:interleukin-13 receptor subunit alpha-1 [Clinocottus analis]|uniref:interleukin-13 receptor subunit alpha-1 n=1 Tax=Clinocottus analis TaxID=304258 RepID=UPI0035C22F4C